MIGERKGGNEKGRGIKKKIERYEGSKMQRKKAVK